MAGITSGPASGRWRAASARKVSLGPFRASSHWPAVLPYQVFSLAEGSTNSDFVIIGTGGAGSVLLHPARATRPRMAKRFMRYPQDLEREACFPSLMKAE